MGNKFLQWYIDTSLIGMKWLLIKDLVMPLKKLDVQGKAI